MFLTRMPLNPARRGTRFLLGSPQRLHAAVLSSFPPTAATAPGAERVLWRLDRGRSHDLVLFIASPAKPDLSHLVEQAGWPTAPEATWQTASMAPLLARLETGQRWAFRLTANPVHNKPQPGAARGKRQGHRTAEHQLAWLTSRAERWGFSLAESDGASSTITARDVLSFDRRSEGARSKVVLTVATFDGILRVTDPDALRRSLVRGLGRAKGYGCGLLTLAPVS